MYFEINVSKNGRHYFATAQRSLRDPGEAQTAYEDLRARFPEAEGFEVTVTKYETVGTQLKW